MSDVTAASGPHDHTADPTAYVENGLILIGCSKSGRQFQPEMIELALANRHGLVTGATGTGKTVTLQVLAEGFSAAGVPVFAADIKGDLSGIGVKGEHKPHLVKRAEEIGLPAMAMPRSRCASGTSSASRATPCAPPSRRWGRCCCRGCSSSPSRRKACSTSPSAGAEERAAGDDKMVIRNLQRSARRHRRNGQARHLSCAASTATSPRRRWA